MYQKVTLIGKLGKDPKITPTKNSRVAHLDVATWDNVKREDGKYEQITEWHNVTVWGNAVKMIEKLTKGDFVLVDGKIHTSEWTNKDGEAQKSTAIVGFVRGIKPPQKYDNNYQYPQETINNKPTWTPDKPSAQPQQAQPDGMNFTYSDGDGADLPFN